MKWLSGSVYERNEVLRLYVNEDVGMKDNDNGNLAKGSQLCSFTPTLYSTKCSRLKSMKCGRFVLVSFLRSLVSIVLPDLLVSLI